MGSRDDIVDILKTEYGIETLAQLQKEIAKLSLIDLSPFCAEMSEKRR